MARGEAGDRHKWHLVKSFFEHPKRDRHSQWGQTLYERTLGESPKVVVGMLRFAMPEA